MPGGANRSYGIQVARLAGLPQEITERAREILTQLEGGNQTLPDQTPGPKPKHPRAAKDRESGMQLSIFRQPSDWVRDRVAALQLDTMSPMAALKTLYALQEQILGSGEASPAAPDEKQKQKNKSAGD